MKGLVCAACGQALINDEIALNLRLRGNGIGRFYCMDCLGEQMGCPAAELYRLREHFKRMGCVLFEREYIR